MRRLLTLALTASLFTYDNISASENPKDCDIKISTPRVMMFRPYQDNVARIRILHPSNERNRFVRLDWYQENGATGSSIYSIDEDNPTENVRYIHGISPEPLAIQGTLLQEDGTTCRDRLVVDVK